MSTQELCRYLATAEDRSKRQKLLVRHSIRSGVKKRKRFETSLERITSDDEAKYAEREEKTDKRMALEDTDYEESAPA